MVSESKFSSIFNYNSAFKYESFAPVSKPVNKNFYRSAFSYHSCNINPNEDVDEIEETSWISSFMTKTVIVLSYLLIIISFPFSMWICIKKISSLERIVLMRLGKMQPVKGPGFTIILPFIDIWNRIDLRPQAFTISTSQLLTADGAIIEAKCDIQYQISDVVSYVTKLKKQEKTLKDLGLYCLTNIISEKDQDDLLNNRELISYALKDELNQSALKWGLEIIHVQLYSVNILKAAEPVNVLGTLVNVLKATAGNSTQHTTAAFPFYPDMMRNAKKTESFDSQDASPVDILKSIICATENEVLLGNLTANFKFDIVGNTTKSVGCVFENGIASVLEDPGELKPDVSVIMTEDNMKDFLKGAVSPLEAYMDGKVMVMGDWTLLRPLGKILGKQLNF